MLYELMELRGSIFIDLDAITNTIFPSSASAIRSAALLRGIIGLESFDPIDPSIGLRNLLRYGGALSRNMNPYLELRGPARKSRCFRWSNLKALHDFTVVVKQEIS